MFSPLIVETKFPLCWAKLCFILMSTNGGINIYKNRCKLEKRGSFFRVFSVKLSVEFSQMFL